MTRGCKLSVHGCVVSGVTGEGGSPDRKSDPQRLPPTKRFQLVTAECWPGPSAESRTLRCRSPSRRDLRRSPASSSLLRPRHCSGSATSPSRSSALQCQGFHMTTPASPHCAFMCIQGFRFMNMGQPLICRFFKRTAVRILRASRVSPLPLRHQPILRSTPRFPSR